MKLITPVITIDGPSGVGKSTLCKDIAQYLGWNILDSGAIYRSLALEVLQYHIDFESEEELLLKADNMKVYFTLFNSKVQVFLHNKNVTDKIRTLQVSSMASYIATFPNVRKILLYRQREFKKDPGLIADGRDMGTTVFPDANIKFFLQANLQERARRRMLQLQKHGFSVNFNEILHEIKQRDIRDSNRLIAPLRPAFDAIVLDSTNVSKEQLIKKVLYYVHDKLNI